MNKIFKAVNNTSTSKRYLISKGGSNNIWVEINIDYDNMVFTAKRLNGVKVGDEWVESYDYTFPSSLLNEFLNSSNIISSEE